MERHQSIDQFWNQLIGFFQRDTGPIYWKSVEGRAMQAGETLEAIDGSFLFEREGVALKSMGCVENAGAAAGGFLASRLWGAESVPRKKRLSPLVAARRSANRCCSRFATGRQ